MICKQCGAENSDSCVYCVGCGAMLTPPELKKTKKFPFWLLTAAAVLLAAATVLYFLLR